MRTSSERRHQSLTAKEKAERQKRAWGTPAPKARQETKKPRPHLAYLLAESINPTPGNPADLS